MIEEKIARLPPELRQEAEDFVDYLLKRYGDYVEQHKITPSPIILAQESDLSNPPKDTLSNDPILDMDVLEAAGGRNHDGEGSKTGDCSNILEWID
jgi:hypothetical protein